MFLEKLIESGIIYLKRVSNLTSIIIEALNIYLGSACLLRLSSGGILKSSDASVFISVLIKSTFFLLRILMKLLFTVAECTSIHQIDILCKAGTISQ